MLVVPSAHLRERRGEHAAREIADCAGALRERHELVRHHYTEPRMLPARERLHSVDDPAALGEARLRLVVRHDLAGGDAALEVVGVERSLLRGLRSRELHPQVAEQHGLRECAVHLEALARAEVVGRGEHALVDAAHDEDRSLEAASDEHPQQLDAVPVGKVQIHRDQRRPERVDEGQEFGGRARARDRIVELMRRRGNESTTPGSSSTIRRRLALSLMLTVGREVVS